MKKIIFFLFVFIASISFSYIFIYSQDVLIYPNRTINFYTDERFYVQVYRFDVTRYTLKGIISGSIYTPDFELKKEDNNYYSIKLPDISGVYFIIIKGEETQRSEFFYVTDFKAFVASTDSQYYFSVYDLRNQKFVDKLYYYKDNKKEVLHGPVFSFDIDYYKQKAFFNDNNVVILQNSGGRSYYYPEKKAIVFTDKPIYKPGDTIHVRVNAFKRDVNKYVPYKTTLNVALKDPFNNIIFREEFKTDEFGGAIFDYKTTEEIITGNYTLIISQNDKVISWYYILVSDYIKPTYTISLTSDASQLVAGSTSKVKLEAKYLNGDPVKNAEVLFYAFYGADLINKYNTKTNENGEASYEILVKEPGYYRVQALIVDDSGIQNEQNIYLTAKADNVDIKSDLENEILRLYITDLSGNPLSGGGIVEINDEENYFEVKNGYAEMVLPKYVWRVVVKFGKEVKVIYRSWTISDSGILAVNKSIVKPNEKLKITVDPKDDVGILVAGAEKISYFIIITCETEMEIEIPKDVVSTSFFVQYRGLKYRDLIKIKVDNGRVKTLKINLDKPQYKPGEVAKIKLEDAKSDSVKIVSVVDEGIYLLSNAKSVINQLYPEVNYPLFKTYTSREYVYFDILSQFEKSKESHMFASSKESEERRIREYFPETAYWNPSLMENEISLKTPDSITKWRVIAYEITKDYIAEGNESFVVTKPFEVKIFLPQFLIEGDEVKGEIYLKNYTGKTGKVEVKLSVNNGVVDFNSGIFEVEKDLVIPFTLKEVKEGNLEITAEASMLNEYDGLKLTIPVEPIYIPVYKSNIIKIDGEMIFDSDAKIRIIKDLRDILEPSIKALIHYPYGCVEQTMSSFYPALVAKSFIEYPNLDDIILKGLQRLLKFQHSDGGWRWLTNDDSDLFMTSYVLEGLYYTRHFGFYVPNNVISDGLTYLKKQELNGYAAFVLNLYGIKDFDFEPKDVIDYVFVDPDKIKDLAIEGSDVAYIEGTSTYSFYTTTHLTSVAIRTLTRHNKYLDLRDKMVNYLLKTKNGPFWYSTKDTAFAVLAILESQNFNDYRSNLTLEEKDGKVLVSGNGFVEVERLEKVYTENKFNGITINSKLFKRFDLLYDEEYLDVFLPIDTKFIPINMSKTSTPNISSEIPEEILKITTDGTPIAFYNNKLLIEGPFKFVGNDYYFEDGYYEINFVENNDFELHEGDILKTSIFIDGKGEYLVVEEYLPACAQVLKNYSERRPDYEGKFSYRWYSDYSDLWYSYRDVKKDKVAFFIRYLRPGELEYYWRVTNEGSFYKKPTHVYNMYYEDTYAFGSGCTFNIK